MSRSRWVVSVLLVYHVCALALSALPPPDQIPPLEPTRATNRNALAAAAAPRLDAAAGSLVAVHGFLWSSTARLRPMAVWYGDLTGIGQQRWRMFRNPPKYDEYLQARYYVGTANGTRPDWAAAELVFPAHREDTIRLIQSFRDSYTDKAIAIALGDYWKAEAAAHPDGGSAVEGSSRYLAPLANHFAGQFAKRHLLPHERVLRTELWLARAPNAAPGAAPDTFAALRRRHVLERYYAGPIEERPYRTPYAARKDGVKEDDFLWVMEYASNDGPPR